MLKSNRGLTLIELVIVAAMLVVLAAIAVPQVTAYSENSANAAAAADIRNASMAEKAFFADWGVYASSAPGASPGAGVVMTSFADNTGSIWANSLNGAAPSRDIPAPGFQINVSQNVGVVINTSSMSGSYTMAAKNVSGDRCFGIDSDTKEVYWVNGPMGAFLSSEAIPMSSAGFSDFAGIVSPYPCSGFPGGQGQVMWGAL